MSFFQQWEVLFVALLGALTGATELIRRYPDAPLRAIRTGGALIYIGVNLVAAIIALLFLQTFGGIQETDASKRAIYEILIAGIGSMVLLRLSFFKATTTNDSEVSIGPAYLLDTLLKAADTSVGQRLARERTKDAAEVMKDVSFDKAFGMLPTLCIGLMPTLVEEDQNSIASQVALIQGNLNFTPHARSLLLGALLMRFFGLDMLREAIERLGADIKYDVPPPLQPIEPAILTEMLDEIKRSMESDSR